MIYESSKDYGTGMITMHFDEDSPTLTEIDDYLTENYNIGVTGTVEVEQPSMFHGYFNPGVIKVCP